MTLTQPLPTKALASLLAALLLSTTLAVAVPTHTRLPSMLSAFDVAAADAHVKPHCYEQTVQVQNRHGTATSHTIQRRICVNLEHSHWYRSVHMAAAMGLACGALGFAMGGPAGAFGVGVACGVAGGAIGAIPR